VLLLLLLKLEVVGLRRMHVVVASFGRKTSEQVGSRSREMQLHAARDLGCCCCLSRG
jgi:hypothetical protein